MEQSQQIYSKFRKSEYLRPSPNGTYNYLNIKGIKHLPRLRLGLSHLCDHIFEHGFLDSLNPICSCDFDIETTYHFLLYCPNFINERSLPLNNVSRLTKDNCLLVTLQLSHFSFMMMIHWIW